MPKKDVGRSMSLTSQESYSAVIIADMVAEVQNQSDLDSSHQKNNSVRRSSSARSEVLNRKGSSRHKKEATNLGFDGQQTESSSPAAVVDVDAMETVSLGKSNGTDITKGVILNAQLDHKLGSDFLNGGGKPIEMKNVADGKDSKELISADFKNMSVLRRIAFAASFLPSIMFVLCFAVILPCEKKLPCIENMWTTSLNTSVTSDLKFPESIVFSYFQGGTSGLQGISNDTGIVSWDETLPSPPRFVDCANLITNDSQACLVSDPSGAVHFYNAQTGDQLLRWDPTNGVEGAPTPSLPALLPDCDGDGITEVVVAVSPSKFVLFKGFSVFTVDVPSRCDHMPERLFPWTTKNGTELVFTCHNGTNEHLVRISQEKWCVSLRKNKGKGEIVTLDTRTSGSLANSLILPAGDGIVVWSEEEVTMIELDGRKRWTMPTQEHNSKNRFLLYGKFNKTDTQVALFSSDILTSLQVSTLSSATGERMWNRTVANAEISDVSLVQGAEKDFALIAMKKIEKDLADQAVTHLSEVSTSVINLLSKEEIEAQTVNVTSSTTVSEEISLMELNGDFMYTVEDKKTTFSEGEAFSSAIAVIPKQIKNAKDLKIVALKKPVETTSGLPTQLKRINVMNWDISLSQNKQCFAGTFK